MAAALRAALAAGEDVAPRVRDIFLGLGVPVLGDTDAAAIAARVSGGRLLALDGGARAIAASLAAGETCSLDEAIAALSAAGFSAASPAGPLTRAYLTAKLEPASTRAVLGTGEGTLSDVATEDTLVEVELLPP